LGNSTMSWGLARTLRRPAQEFVGVKHMDAAQRVAEGDGGASIRINRATPRRLTLWSR